MAFSKKTSGCYRRAKERVTSGVAEDSESINV